MQTLRYIARQLHCHGLPGLRGGSCSPAQALLLSSLPVLCTLGRVQEEDSYPADPKEVRTMRALQLQASHAARANCSGRLTNLSS